MTFISALDSSSTISDVGGERRQSLRSFRWKNSDNGLASQQKQQQEQNDGRFLQAYTNETTGYDVGPAVNQDREVDFEYCYGALQRADTNNDGRLETADYLNFVQDLGSNTECLGDLFSLPVMPIELTACWNQLSCECRARGGAPDCCEKEKAHIPLSGVNAAEPAPSSQTTPQPPQEPYIEQEQKFLRQTCLRTDQCVISFCGYPPPPLPLLPPVPATISPTASVVAPTIKEGPVIDPNYLYLLLLLLLLCCCRRRWILCPADEDDEDEEDLEQAPPVLGPDGLPLGGDDYDGVYNDPDANRTALLSTAVSENDEGGGVRYYRVVQEPEYEEPPPPPEPKVIDQYDKGLPEGTAMGLKHVEKLPPPPPEDDPFALEHYEPDGGIVEHQREGEWSYEAEGGYTPEEQAAKSKSEWNRPGYERAAVVAAVATDDRRDRNLAKYDGGAIFDHLDETDEPPKKGESSNPLQWVFSKTLNTLDDNQDDLRSEPSTRSLQG